MSQENSLTYQVKVSYYVRDIDNNGQPIARVVKDAPVEVLKMQRLNKAHSDLILKCLVGKLDVLDACAEFVKCAVVDDKIREAILEDNLACFALYGSDKVQEDIGSFFENWDYTKNPGLKATKKE